MSTPALPLKRLVVSAPFGEYLRRPYATSTLGTYTLNPRAGRLRRWWRVLRTLRPVPFVGGAWVNRLGLPNPGVEGLRGRDVSDCIVSVHGFDAHEWRALAHAAYHLKPLALEANLSCPNVGRQSTGDLIDGCVSLLGCGCPVIAKLPPLDWRALASRLYAEGVRHFHACNTLPTPRGGLSGKPLKPLALSVVRDLRQAFGGSVVIVGGGGVTTPEDALEYREAGADHVAAGSVLLSPLRWGRLRAIAEAE